MRRNRWFLNLAAAAVVAASCGSTAATAQTFDVKSVLQEASYVFNRFDEEAIEIKADIELHYPDQVKAITKQGLEATQNAAIEPAHRVLNSRLGKSHVSSADLLDVYMGLVSISGELADTSEGAQNWGNETLAIELTKLRAKTDMVAAKSYVALKDQILEQETKLPECPQQKTTRK